MRVDLIGRDCELEISDILLMVDPGCDASTPGCLVVISAQKVQF